MAGPPTGTREIPVKTTGTWRKDVAILDDEGKGGRPHRSHYVWWCASILFSEIFRCAQLIAWLRNPDEIEKIGIDLDLPCRTIEQSITRGIANGGRTGEGKIVGVQHQDAPGRVLRAGDRPERNQHQY